MDFKHGLPIGGTDAFVNKGQVYIEFFHIPTHETVRFKGFVESFQDNYDVAFKKELVYGRMDPIAIFEGTSRNIQLSWKLVAETEQEAYANLQRAQKYIQMLYPSYNKFTYDGQFSVSTLSTPPLLKLKFMNLIGDASSQGLYKPEAKKDEIPAVLDPAQKDLSKRINIDFAGGDAKDAGLLVIPGNMSINHNLAEEGAILARTKLGQETTAIPYVISMNSVYTVLHEHSLGSERAYRVKGNRRAVRRAQQQLEKAQAGADLASIGSDTATSLITGVNNTNAAAQRNLNRAKKRLSKAKQKGSVIKRLTGRTPRTNKDFQQFPYGATEKIK